MRLALPGVAAALVLAGMALAASSKPPVTFSAAERAAILAQGPWPAPQRPDPSNRYSGNADAIALGRRLFFDTRLSIDGRHSCATCHDPAKVVRRRQDAQPRPRPGRPQRHRTCQSQAQSLVRLGRRCRQSLGTEHPPDRGGKGAGPHRATLRERMASEPALAAAYNISSAPPWRTMTRSACSSTSPRRSPRSRRRS